MSTKTQQGHSQTGKTGHANGANASASQKQKKQAKPGGAPPKATGAAQAGAGGGNGRLLAWGAIGLVIVVAASFAVVKAVGHPSAKPAQKVQPAAVAQVVARATTVPASVLDAAGAPQTTNVPTSLPPRTPALSQDGLPHVLYVGAEYCPFCASQRWAMVVALSRFGTFSGLGLTHSSTSDVYPGTATFSFHGVTYQSQYLTFTGLETQTNVQGADGTYGPLDKLTSQQATIYRTYDEPPYVQSKGGIPFTDFGNRYVMAGTLFSPQILRGMTAQQIAATLADPGSQVGGVIDSSANLATAVICQLTGGQPGSVCTSSGVVKAAAMRGAH